MGTSFAGSVQVDLFDGTEALVEREDRIKWCQLVSEMLPAAAREREWSIKADHCFARILLDVTFGRPWREIVKAPAWHNAPIDELRRATALGKAVLDGSQDVEYLNEVSMLLRGHARIARRFGQGIG